MMTILPRRLTAGLNKPFFMQMLVVKGDLRPNVVIAPVQENPQPIRRQLGDEISGAANSQYSKVGALADPVA